MCGICGLLHADTARPVDPEVVRSMTEAMVHRGPDDHGYFVEGYVGLGMRRLSIIDLSGGRQPVANEDNTLHLVHNGEIYNYRELRRRLEAAGHAFATSSDTEVIVHAYEESGTDSLRRLRGMFSLGLWDGRRRCLLLAVDRFGIKPLYYAASSSGVAFGSELKCLLRSGMVTRKLDPDALGQYFTFGYIPPPATIFDGVRKLPPGTMLRWSPERGAEISQYWDFPRDHVSDKHSRAETQSQLRAALADAVRSHLVSDVPVGAFLSGGIDSSTIVALMSEISPEPVRTFSIGFADQRYSELDKARVVARRFGTDHHELIVEPQSVELLPTLAAHFGEPFADSSALPMYHVSRLAREHVKVVLSGDGGDELFLGYTMFHGLELARIAQFLPSALRRFVVRLSKHTPTTRSPFLNDRAAVLLKRVTDTMLPPELAFKRKISAPGLDATPTLLSSDLSSALVQHDPFRIIDTWLDRYSEASNSHPLERFVHTFFQTSLAGDMLVKVDRMSMANSLEVRVPLLDHLLAGYVDRIPVDCRMHRWRLKGLLKDSLADTLPTEILKAPKRGFAVPLAAWFRGDLESYAREMLVSPDVARRGFLNTRAVERTISRHSQGGGTLGTLIWVLLMFELWCREMLD
jgi:asparagine synthase (glutamine-hydrolysing)